MGVTEIIIINEVGVDLQNKDGKFIISFLCSLIPFSVDSIYPDSE